MRQLSPTLLAAQRQAVATPSIRVEAKNQIAGVVRCDWSRLYTGTEADYFHALAMPGDGSLVRARVTPPADSRKLYRQRVAAPTPGSDFSQWVYTGQYNAVVAAAASLGAEVSIFWINTSREVRCIKSTDGGTTWGSPQLIDYTPTTSVYGLAAAYKPGGDLAIFFADQATLYVKKRLGGQWQTKAAWNKTTGDLSGIACLYDGDWDLLVTGKDSGGSFKLWGLVYGDGGDVASGSWSALRELASAPAGGGFEFRQPFLDKPDVCRCFFIEKFTGNEAYSRPFWSHTALGTKFIDGLWREPVPFNLSSEYGLAMAHHGNYGWLSSPSGVWRAGLSIQSLDLTGDVMAIRQEVGEMVGRLTVELRNDDGRYALPGQGNLAVLAAGGELDFSPGYVTSSGGESSPGQSYILEAYEHTSFGGQAALVLQAYDGWGALGNWRARSQSRWNKASSEMSVRDILAFVLARAGLELEAVSQSSVITGFYPDFTIGAGSDGRAVVQKLLSFVPDLLFAEGNKVYIVNPLSSDSSVYNYGGQHPIVEGRYRRGAWGVSRVLVEGYSAGSLLADSFAWGEIDRAYDRLRLVADVNLGTVAAARERGQAYLRRAEIEASDGSILVPVNCGQQLYDVVDVTDIRAGLEAEKWRVLGMTLVYNPWRGEYRQRLKLGTV
jgi:hypothetical protein